MLEILAIVIILITITCHFPQKSPIISGSFVENNLQKYCILGVRSPLSVDLYVHVNIRMDMCIFLCSCVNMYFQVCICMLMWIYVCIRRRRSPLSVDLYVHVDIHMFMCMDVVNASQSYLMYTRRSTDGGDRTSNNYDCKKVLTSFHSSPSTYQTYFHGSLHIFIQVFTCVNGVPVTQKIYQEN